MRASTGRGRSRGYSLREQHLGGHAGGQKLLAGGSARSGGRWGLACGRWCGCVCGEPGARGGDVQLGAASRVPPTGVRDGGLARPLL